MEEFHISSIPFAQSGMPNKLFDSIGSYRPILAFGKNDTTEFVKKNKIGWVLPFNDKKVKKFLKEINNIDILKKSENIKKIRKKYSKEYLYSNYLNYIYNIFNKSI